MFLGKFTIKPKHPIKTTKMGEIGFLQISKHFPDENVKSFISRKPELKRVHICIYLFIYISCECVCCSEVEIKETLPVDLWMWVSATVVDGRCHQVPALLTSHCVSGSNRKGGVEMIIVKLPLVVPVFVCLWGMGGFLALLPLSPHPDTVPVWSLRV